MSDKVYKVLTQVEWSVLEDEGEFAGSKDDQDDGFIHLSTKDQYRGVIARHFKGIKPLYIVEFSTAGFGDALKWETAKSGELFPHLYHRSLLRTAVTGIEIQD
ncbi:DUF952 domain-containing protein [Endozoicomonas elysicola]|uniref:DUF952 domain-containing protein n=1 Tax=Endozoicomonas elysicola TaxID=305900 RepID=UPI00035C38BD|nr:DUF952 domain-containing protein [Endozoicomonas elysicola]